MRTAALFISLFAVIYACNDKTNLARAEEKTDYYRALIDECDTPLPTDRWYYHAMGGDRGVLNARDVSFTWDNQSAYKIEIIRKTGYWTWGGMWYSLIKINRDSIPLNFKAILGPYIKAKNQPTDYPAEVTGLELKIKEAKSSSGIGLNLRMELKDINDKVIAKKTWRDIASTEYPRTVIWNLETKEKQKVKMVLLILDYAHLGDSITIDNLVLKTSVPDSSVTPIEDQAFIWSLSWLLNNYDPETGMVQDRSNFHTGDFENVSATAKTAKVVYYGYKKGYITYADAKTIITKIADTLLRVVPKGPAGVNKLWPHFTKKGGTEAIPDSEWASGDTAFAVLDLISALQLLEDPQKQLPSAEDFLKSIDWQKLVLPDGSISHGYTPKGSRIADSWKGFGMETLGVIWAKASATNSTAFMGAPPSDNGSGFIDNAQFPIVFSGIDFWRNDWDAYREKMADKQIAWYKTAPHKNDYLAQAGLFGLSAAERPGVGPNDSDAYAAYGVGNGNVLPIDGNHDVVVLHYPAMISDIRPNEAKRMWQVLTGEQRNENAAKLLDGKIVVSPLNNMESMSVDKTTGKITIRHFKGSWNLALQAEGWALSDPAIRQTLKAAILKNKLLSRDYQILSSAPQK